MRKGKTKCLIIKSSIIINIQRYTKIQLLYKVRKNKEAQYMLLMLRYSFTLKTVQKKKVGTLYIHLCKKTWHICIPYIEYLWENSQKPDNADSQGKRLQ